jgi:hypothetical protein
LFSVREFDDGQPKVFDVADDGDKLLEVNGFGDVAVGVKVVGLEDVFFRFRGSENDDGNAFQVGVGFDFSENFATVFEGKVEVQENQVGTGMGLEFALTAQAGEGFFPITRYHQVIADFAVGEYFLCEADIGGIVLDE